MGIITFLGLFAGFLTSFSLLPQAIKAAKTKQTRDISLPMIIILCLGLIFWLIYGTLIQDLPLVIANIASLIFAGSILVFKVRYK
ncbi:MAG: SemiSWEET transporter [bacterium]